MRLRSMMVLLVFVLIAATPRLAHPVGHTPPAVQDADLADFDLPLGYLAEKILTPPLQFPSSVDIGPSDTIVVTDNVGDRVIQVHEDGTLTTYAAPSSNRHSAVAFDSTGNLFVVDRAGVLWKVTSEGTVTQMAGGVHPGALDVGPSGDIFAAAWHTTDVQRITADGQVTVYASGFSAADDVAVSPITGDVYVADSGASAIFKANADGTISLLTDGLSTDPNFLAFASDGTLYHNSSPTGLSIISTADGTRTEITWIRDRTANLVIKNIAIDGQGRVISVDHTYNHVVRFDMGAETIDVLSLGIGNSSALAVAPNEGGIYLGVGHPSSDGKGRVVHIEADGSATTFIEGLPPSVDAMAFNADGVGYISAMQTIYTTTLNGITGTLITLPYVAYSLAVDPITGYLWGSGYKELWYLDDTGVRHTIAFTISTGVDVDLAFMPDGTLYVHTNTSDSTAAPVERGVYRLDPAGPTFTLIADLTTVNMCCPLGRIGIGRDGNIYWVGNGDRHTPGNEQDMHMLRITPAGEVTLFGRHLPVDPAAVTASPDSTDLYFSSASGVYRVFEANVVFIPLVLKSND